ncbi:MULTISPECIES: LysR family transcriptional regulator [unclassified Microbacterium]|uniref:LysR family transcriptional regulator n=1 Tax=unclassified Microbacterium TaxID=2609290 RepID=UPI001D45FE0C|nr:MULTISPECIES: LysR family transcriptional regulator [unclassified Microbacterium]CAH0123049.1 HTH-type transcriptional regulator DmlR [Microbacterium sp. Bi121]HWK76248.1 LysR family transcriptional regulator [Microbacterium sp.]
MSAEITDGPAARPSPDDLLVLLAVSRTGRFTAAGETLGLNHTTVSRRIAALETVLGGRTLAKGEGGWELTDLGRRAVRAAEDVEAAMSTIRESAGRIDQIAGVVRISATDGFSAFVIAPAVAELRREHPQLSVEIVNVTRRALQYRSGLDMEVVVGEPQVHRAEAIRLGHYTLGMYASRDYMAEFGEPVGIAEMRSHPLVYFVDSMLQVDDLDAPRRLVPGMQDSLSSTNVFVHVEATRAGAGIGFLPCFLADRHPDLVRLLPEEFAERLPYWLVLRPDSLRQPAVAAVADALRRRTAAVQSELLGLPGADSADAARVPHRHPSRS